MLSDLNTAASELGLGPRPLDVAVANPEGGEGGGDDDDDDDDNKEEGEVIMLTVKNGLSGGSLDRSVFVCVGGQSCQPLSAMISRSAGRYSALSEMRRGKQRRSR